MDANTRRLLEEIERWLDTTDGTGLPETVCRVLKKRINALLAAPDDAWEVVARTICINGDTRAAWIGAPPANGTLLYASPPPAAARQNSHRLGCSSLDGGQCDCYFR